MNILVTGGAGFIGSHTCVTLLEANHDVILVDNFSNSNKNVIDKIELITNKQIVWYEVDVTDLEAMKPIFERHQIDGIIHFAGYKSVGESVVTPIKYYKNNLISTLNLLELCEVYKVNKFVFSSSATVYGDNNSPLQETMLLKNTTNPYGETKAMSERILKDVSKANPNLSITLLRYFNPVGAHISGKLGESPNGIPNNLMPYITKVAKQQLNQLNIFGDDYDTVDGTGVRDYIHVVDLAEGHLAALEHIKIGLNVYNLGTGKGTSVLELVSAFKRVNNIEVPYKIVERRPGDLAECYANVELAQKELHWKAKKTVDEMCKDAWRFEKDNS